MIELENVSKTYPGGVEAVRGISFEVSEEETFVLVGVSGCGKTTTLKMINRLVEPSSGTIRLNGRDIMERSPEQLRRGIGYVIQDIALFPHMTIAENVGIVLRLTGTPLEDRREQARELLQLVEMDPDEFMDRYPTELSGGQQQRVGVVRALAADPSVLLMDEPFGALDPITREQLQLEFLQLEEHIRKTIVLVTHDIFEAVLLGDRVGVMADGQLVQAATPDELINQPANDLVEQFLGQHRMQLQLTSMKALECAASPETAEQRTVEAETNAKHALAAAKGAPDAFVIVREDGTAAGVARRDELINADEGKAGVGSLIDENIPSLHRSDNVLEILRTFTKHDVGTVPVAGDDDKVAGIVTRASAAEAVNDALGLSMNRE